MDAAKQSNLRSLFAGSVYKNAVPIRRLHSRHERRAILDVKFRQPTGKPKKFNLGPLGTINQVIKALGKTHPGNGGG